MKARIEIPKGWKRVRRGLLKVGDRLFCDIEFIWEPVLKNSDNLLGTPMTRISVSACGYVIRKR